MNTYTIVYEEKLVDHFPIDAENKQEALRIFNRQLKNGEIDFSHMDISNVNITILEVDDD